MFFESNIFYVNEEHAENYKKLSRMNPSIRVDLEVRSAAYILALPELYSKCADALGENHLDMDKVLATEGLTKPYLLMVELAADLLYGATSKRFGIAEGLQEWDDNLFRVFMQAIRMRKGVFGPKVN